MDHSTIEKYYPEIKGVISLVGRKIAKETDEITSVIEIISMLTKALCEIVSLTELTEIQIDEFAEKIKEQMLRFKKYYNSKG